MKTIKLKMDKLHADLTADNDDDDDDDAGNVSETGTDPNDDPADDDDDDAPVVDPPVDGDVHVSDNLQRDSLVHCVGIVCSSC